MERELMIEACHTERNYWRGLFRYRELIVHSSTNVSHWISHSQ